MHAVTPLLDAGIVAGLSHVTGGGLVGNTSRILPQGLGLHIAWGSWTVPPIFSLIQHAGSISNDEMQHVFNLGVGMVIIVRPDDVDTAMNLLAAHSPFHVGAVVAS